MNAGIAFISRKSRKTDVAWDNARFFAHFRIPGLT